MTDATESTSRKHEHFGTVIREADPRIVLDSGTRPGGGWATLVLSAPPTPPYTSLRAMLSPSRERAHEVHARAAEWVRELTSAVVCDPEVCQGHPVVRGTRVWVDQILAYVEGGVLDWEAVHFNYPTVPREAAESIAALPGHVQRTLEALCE